ncbi:MAG: hypothetical protein ACRCSP_00595 [Rhodoglobus sp.]
MSDDEKFSAARREADPIQRGRRATELLTLYQQRATELARLRREAIEQAHQEYGMSYTEIASALGITKGRVTQIRGRAPQTERAFFGVGPVEIGVPYRYQVTDRERPLIAAEDAAAAEQLERLLMSMGFAVNRFQIEPDHAELPDVDAIIVCGPKSAPLAAQLLHEDPAVRLIETRGRWWIEESQSGARHGSPTDDNPAQHADVAYVARHCSDEQTTIHIAGLHAIGSLGAAYYLTNHLSALFQDTGNRSFSCVVRSSYTGLDITDSELIAGPFIW